MEQPMVLVLREDHLQNLLGWHRECGPYCVGEEHADVSWIAFKPGPDHEDEVTRAEIEQSVANSLADYYGVTFVKLVLIDLPLPAVKQLYTTAHDLITGDSEAVFGDHPLAAGLAYLSYRTHFTTPIPIRQLREYIAATKGTGS